MSTLAAGIYLSTGLAYVLPAETDPRWTWSYQATRFSEPYGVVAAGWSTAPDRMWSAQIELRHISSIGADLRHGGNQGTNSVEARLTWRPFK